MTCEHTQGGGGGGTGISAAATATGQTEGSNKELILTSDVHEARRQLIQTNMSHSSAPQVRAPRRHYKIDVRPLLSSKMDPYQQLQARAPRRASLIMTGSAFRLPLQQPMSDLQEAATVHPQSRTCT